MKIRPVGAELFQADRHDEPRVAFRSLANAPNKTDVTLRALALLCHKQQEQSVDRNTTVYTELQVSSLVDCRGLSWVSLIR
jgi:hypothetical protein